MKVALTSTGPSLDARLDPRFGRCAWFVLVETDDMSIEAIENSSASLGGGAGIKSAQRMAQMGAKIVLTGNCGPNAHQTLSAAGIDVVVGCDGTGLRGSRALQVWTTPRHFRTQRREPRGHGRRPAMSNGREFGAGHGWGKGRGVGRGGGRGATRRSRLRPGQGIRKRRTGRKDCRRPVHFASEHAGRPASVRGARWFRLGRGG